MGRDKNKKKENKKEKKKKSKATVEQKLDELRQDGDTFVPIAPPKTLAEVLDANVEYLDRGTRLKRFFARIKTSFVTLYKKCWYYDRDADYDRIVNQ